MFDVIWEPPSSESGGGPVTSYQAQVRIGNETWRNCTTTAEERSCLFEGLVKETKYHARVRAVNVNGPSNWSEGPIEADYAGILSIYKNTISSNDWGL